MKAVYNLQYDFFFETVKLSFDFFFPFDVIGIDVDFQFHVIVSKYVLLRNLIRQDCPCHCIIKLNYTNINCKLFNILNIFSHFHKFKIHISTKCSSMCLCPVNGKVNFTDFIHCIHI